MRSLKLLLLFGVAIMMISCSCGITGATPTIIQASETATSLPMMTTSTLTMQAEESEIPTTKPAPTYTNTPTPTPLPLDYAQLASQYLTPFTPMPTTVVFVPKTNGTPKPPIPTPNSLLPIIARKPPGNWTPTPPPTVPPPPQTTQTPRPTIAFDYTAGFIQAATDLMNFTDADQSLFLGYVDAWATDGRVMGGACWILKGYFDNTGQPEWLVSVPDYSLPWWATGYYDQIVILYEKSGGVYRPLHYETEFASHSPTDVLFVGDLKGDGYPDIVLRSNVCGSGCDQILLIDEWDGKTWTTERLHTEPSEVRFIDYYHDGKTEIVLSYITAYKLDPDYPRRQATDIYGWKDSKFVLLEELLSPNTEPYAVMLDVSSALSAGKIDDALKLAQPNMDRIGQTCTQLETYTAIEVMLAYAVQNKPEAMQSTLAQINAYCRQPENGFTVAANILWEAFNQVHDPGNACKAMQRFITNNLNVPSPYDFLDPSVVRLAITNDYCPIVPFGFR